MILRKELQPGSREPATSDEIDLLLTYVPELAFLPALERCVPDVEGPPHHRAVDAHFDERGIAPVVVTLKTLATEAAAEHNGGLVFLVRTMLHFIEVQPVPPSQHPLLVALYLRGTARSSGVADSARRLADAMDRWD